VDWERLREERSAYSEGEKSVSNRFIDIEWKWNLFAEKMQRYYRLGMTGELRIISVKLPATDVRKIPGNRSEFIRQAVEEKLARESQPRWRPKTATGRKLLNLRQKYIDEGGELLDEEGIARELRSRRGGVN
jgi:hypothetical protein